MNIQAGHFYFIKDEFFEEIKDKITKMQSDFLDIYNYKKDDNIIEKSILQQLFYKEKINKTPY